MAKVTWLVGGAGKNVDAYIAHLPLVKAILRAEAYAGGARAKALLAGHHHGPPPHSKITVTKGSKLDWFVNLEDPLGGAVGIELGRTGRVGQQGGGTSGGHFLTRAFGG